MEALDRAAVEAGEAEAALEKIGEDATYSPEKLEQVEERLFALKAAGRKYNLSVEELPALLEQVETKLKLMSTQTKDLAELDAKAAETKAAYVAAGGERSAKRQQRRGAERPAHSTRSLKSPTPFRGHYPLSENNNCYLLSPTNSICPGPSASILGPVRCSTKPRTLTVRFSSDFRAMPQASNRRIMRLEIVTAKPSVHRRPKLT